MARRSSSSSSLRSPAGRRAASTTEVHCPDCGASYQVPEEKLDRKVQCRQCRRIFVPLNILKKGRRRSGGLGFRPSAAIGLVLAIVLIVVGAVLLHDEFAPKPEPEETRAKAPSGPTPEELVLLGAPVEALERWVSAVKGNDLAAFDLLTDLGTFFDRQPPEARPKDERGRPLTYRAIDPVKKVEWKNLLFRELAEGEAGAPMRGRTLLPNQTQVAAGDPLKDALVQVTALFREGDKVGHEYVLAFDLAREGKSTPPRWVVQSLAVKETPRIVADAGKKRPPARPKGMQEVETTVAPDGKTVIHEHPIVPLDHLEDTAAPLMEEIDRLIAVVASGDARPRDVTNAINRLLEIGRPAFPRLLNLFHDIHLGNDPDSFDNRTILARLIRRLIVPMTLCDFGFDPAGETAEGPEKATANRLSALKQYYAWWARHSSPGYWEDLRKQREAGGQEKL